MEEESEGLFREHLPALSSLFLYYCGRGQGGELDGGGAAAMPLKQLLRLLRHFDVVPTFVSKREVKGLAGKQPCPC